MGIGLVDTYLAYKFIKMLATPWKKMDAYKLGIIDKKGKRIRSEEADDAARSAGSKYTNIHKVIFNIKRLINKLPGGKTKLGGAAAAVWMLKEEAKLMGVQDDTLIERVFVDYLTENGLLKTGINEDFSKLDLIITKGTYKLNGMNITLHEDIKSFDSVLEIPLFKINETVFSSYDITRIEDETFSESVLLGKTIQVGNRLGRIISVISVGDTRGDSIYKVKFQDGTKVEMHDVQLRPFLVHEEVDELEEDAPANSVGGGMSPHFGGEGGIKGYDPLLGKKKKRKKFAGAEVFELCSDDYHTCMHGRKRYERWNKKLNMENIDNQEIRDYAHKNPGSAIVIQDKTTGIMSYLIHGNKK